MKDFQYSHYQSSSCEYNIILILDLLGLYIFFFNLLIQAFKKLDSSKSGRVSVTDIRKYFNSKFRPPLQAGMMSYTYLL